MRSFSLDIEIVPLDRYNWESCVPLEVTDEQKKFVSSNLYLLAQCKFENLNPFAILYRGETAGMVTYGDFNGICWINHIMIDKSMQQKGIGTKALQAVVDYLRARRGCREVRTSVVRENLWALYFFEQAGFETAEEDLGGEVILRLKRKDPLMG